MSGPNPTQIAIFLKQSGADSTQTTIFSLNEWVYSLRKITYNVNKCDELALFSVEAGILPHSNLCFNVKRVGRGPLELTVFL